MQLNTGAGENVLTANFFKQEKNTNDVLLATNKNRHRLFNRLAGNSFGKSDYLLVVASFLLMLASVSFLFVFKAEIATWNELRMNTWYGAALKYFALSLLFVQLASLIYLSVLYLRYKVVKPAADALLPTCTVIVPAYNEGRLVYDTLMSLAGSDFPKEKMQLLAIDDGSKDDTWDWLVKAKAVLGDDLTIYKQPKNMGKRHALYRGFKVGTGDVFVTVDSDSVVDVHTLRNLLSPFVGNDKCGAVAGNVKVLNKEKGIIPKMLNVSFTFSFEFVRSAQSALGSVFCTPGALAAYRKDAVLNCLDDWMNQTFMGSLNTIGEDRAITNMILKQGFDVLFQKNAMVYTNIPEHYNNLSKMFLRWERSNVRENVMMSRFAFTNFREGSTLGIRVILLTQWLNVILAFPLLFLLFFGLFTYPILFLTSALVGILIFSTVQAIFYAKKYNTTEASLAYVYSIFYFFSLFWIKPYALVTVGKNGWLTREIVTEKRAEVVY